MSGKKGDFITSNRYAQFGDKTDTANTLKTLYKSMQIRLHVVTGWVMDAGTDSVVVRIVTQAFITAVNGIKICGHILNNKTKHKYTRHFCLGVNKYGEPTPQNRGLDEWLAFLAARMIRVPN